MKFSRLARWPAGWISALAGIVGAISATLNPTVGAAAVGHQCGVMVSSNVRTETAGKVFQSRTSVRVQGMGVTVSIAAGATRCVKVRLFVLTSCSGTSDVDRCFIQMLDGTTLLDPATIPDDGIDIGAEEPQLAARSFEWVARLGPGAHDIHGQVAVRNAGTNFNIARWTLDVEVDN